VSEIGRLIFRAFHCEMELEYLLSADCWLFQ